MRILLVHPEDTAERGDWIGQNWDRVIDLGRAGTNTYRRWSQLCGCAAAPLEILRREDFQVIRALLGKGLGVVVDREGLDWWELNSMIFNQQMETVLALRKFAEGLGSQDALFVTRPGFHADALRLLVGDRLTCFSSHAREGRRVLHRYLQIWSKFPLPQIVEILGDKYDPSYTVRRRLVPKKQPCRRPVVLLPSAYGNVSRTGIAYANTVPDIDFLLVTTRRSGRVINPPPNIMTAELASYATPQKQIQAEYELLMEKWRQLRGNLQTVLEFDLLDRLGFLDSFPRLLRHGLGIRDAWLGVLQQAPVNAVLCADDTNPYTHIPLLLARARGIPAIACHHGALDGRHLFKRNHADLILAKGRMEEDYLVRVCGVVRDAVEVGAPVRKSSSSIVRKADPGAASTIVFFSEPYEIFGGRAEEFYRDVLPPMADLATRTSRGLVIKLHPAESRRDRERLAKKILPVERQDAIRIVSGPLTDELLGDAWFGVTVLSTVAMECALAGIPCFLCEWLDYGPYRYVQQLSRFGVGQILKSASEIGEIPRLLGRSTRLDAGCDLWGPIERARLKELLSGARKTSEHAVAV
jgi:hypothetical protein